MAKYQHFEELPAWQQPARLYNGVLDLLEEPKLPVTGAFRTQLDRAALSVSNNIAEGFERSTTRELVSFLGIARGSTGEVRSMLAVVRDRPRLKAFVQRMDEIRSFAESCLRQLTARIGAIEGSPIQGKRHMDFQTRERKRAAQEAKEFRTKFLRSLKPEHPLYKSSEAREARGEATDS